jgi:hypothetical protein
LWSRRSWVRIPSLTPKKALLTQGFPVAASDSHLGEPLGWQRKWQLEDPAGVVSENSLLPLLVSFDGLKFDPATAPHRKPVDRRPARSTNRCLAPAPKSPLLSGCNVELNRAASRPVNCEMKRVVSSMRFEIEGALCPKSTDLGAVQHDAVRPEAVSDRGAPLHANVCSLDARHRKAGLACASTV